MQVTSHASMHVNSQESLEDEVKALSNKLNAAMRMVQTLTKQRDERDAHIQELEEINAEMASQMHWEDEWMANQTATDKTKLHGIVHHRYLLATKPRQDGSRYYSREEVAKRLGNIVPPKEKGKKRQPGKKAQSFSDSHTMFRENGLISTVEEPQKSNSDKSNYYDTILPQWENNPRGVVVIDGKSTGKPKGGKRVAIHRGTCGGECVEGKKTYTCKKCHEVRISAEYVLTISAEKWEHWDEERETYSSENLVGPVVRSKHAQPRQEPPAEEELSWDGPPLYLEPDDPPDRDCMHCQTECWKWSVDHGVWCPSCPEFVAYQKELSGE